MESASRRAFLTGRRVKKSPWEEFMSRLRRRADGKVQDLGEENGAARLIPEQIQDVYFARALCVEYGITMALDGLPNPSRLNEAPLLWVDPGLAMAKFNRLGADDSRWFVQPGCLLGELEQAGLPQFKDRPPHLSVAAWLADRQICDWGFGHTADSGLVHAMVMLADGTQANLGAFGVDNQKPLGNIRLQKMIPRLFELAMGANINNLVQALPDGPETVDAAKEKHLFNGRYRIDALKPVAGAGINLAHLLLGHGGELGWVEWLVLDERNARPVNRSYENRYGNRKTTTRSEHDNDAVIRQLFDPDGLFPDRGQKY